MPSPTGSAVQTVVERLPDDEVKLLRMFYQGHELGAGSAAESGLSAATGGARLRRVLAKLRDALAGRGG